MAIIKCPECGNMVSDKAKACVHCGCPISNEATVLIYGLNQSGLIGGTMKIYVNDNFAGYAEKFGSLKISTRVGARITAKCGINLSKGTYIAHAGNQSVQIVYAYGQFLMNEMHFNG